MECTVDEIKSSGDFDSDETYYRLKGQLVTMRNQAMTARNLLLKSVSKITETSRIPISERSLSIIPISEIQAKRSRRSS